MRYPAVPLAVHTPYFSLWSMDDVPNRSAPCHWTGKPQSLSGTVKIGKREYGILGSTDCPPMKTTHVQVDACSTEYRLESPEALVTLRFTSPLLLENLPVMARPVTYLTVETRLKKESPAGEEPPEIIVRFFGDESLCLDHPGQSPVEYRPVRGAGFSAGALSNREQKVLNCSGDDVRIDWGAFYLAVEAGGEVVFEEDRICAEKKISAGEQALFALAYDEVKCIQYFGKELDPLWKEEFPEMSQLLEAAFREREEIESQCREFSHRLYQEALKSGGEEYAEILSAAYRQVIAAHGICWDEDGKLLFVSKECFSNGCAATADVSYPSIPLFLLYRPELVFAMMRPVCRYASSDLWPFEFAPHDAGRYPLLNGQVYSGGTDPKEQMPVEECGNMLLMTAAATLRSGDDSFAAENWTLLTKWAGYLRREGLNPENQLCTDDFAGHLAHNCNLSIKAILGVAAYGLLQKRRGEEEAGEEWLKTAREMGAVWIETAANGDGTYRLAFDRPDTFSLKYNAVWDRLMGTGVFPQGTWNEELSSYLCRKNAYGVPLDNRAGYTKSDWEVWAASMMEDPADFKAMISLLWNAYDSMPQRVPLGDWYETEDAWQVGFQNRTVQGGLFMKVLWERGILGE